MDLRQLHEEYRRAVEAARDESLSDEARATAQADMIEKRHALDAALVEAEEAREDEAREAAVEARMAAMKKLADVKPAIRPNAFPIEQLRAFANREVDKVSFMAMPESRTDMTTSDTTGYGSYTIPQSWYDRVVTFQLAQSGVLQAGPTIIQTSNGAQINVPTLTTDLTSVAGSEGAAATVTNYVFGQALLNQYRIDGFVALSDELLRDSDMIEGVLADLAGRSLGAKMAGYLGDIDVGTGSSAPAAITVGVTSAVTAASTTAVTMDELKTLYYSVLPGYRAQGKWIANSAVTLATALMKDDNGNYMWHPSVLAGQPDTFMGKPWFEDAYFDASASGNIPVVFGDVAAAYWVRRIGGIEVGFSRDFAFTSFETTMRFAMWFDAVTVDAIAVKGITLA